MGYATFFSRSHDAVICVYDDAGNVVETHKQAGRVQRVVSFAKPLVRFRKDPTSKEGLSSCNVLMQTARCGEK
jgi:hypothetical protein